MKFLFGRKKSAQATAEVLEDGRALSAAEMDKPKYRDYSGKEPMIPVRVRVQPPSDPPFEATMKAQLTLSFLLLPGVTVKVSYNPDKNDDVILDDEHQAILARNPQLLKKD